MDHYGIPYYLRRKPKATTHFKLPETVKKEIGKFILYSLLGASIAIAMHTHAETVVPAPMSVPESTDEPPLRTQPVKAPARVTLLAHVTAYTSSIDETDEEPGITASGTTPERGTLACPSRYAFGTRIIINGKTYVCEDRMNARYRNTNRFDMWVSSKAEAYQWGKKTLKIEIKDT